MIGAMVTSAARHVTAATLDRADVLSDDGTRLRAWTNDPGGTRTGPTVLLCNGLGTNPWCWPSLLRPDCDVRVVSWNHRGTGGSARPADRSRVGIEEFVEDALSVMDHFGLDRVPVMGWSMGVNTAFELALRHPERVSGLFGVAGVPGDTFATMLGPLRLPKPLTRALMVNVARGATVAGRLVTPLTRRLPIGARAVASLTHTGFMLPVPDPELAAVAVAEFLTVDVDWYAHLALTTSRHERVSLSGLQVPVSLVGGRWDLLAGSRDMASAARRLPDATYTELRGTHFIAMEQPERVHRLLLSLLERTG